MQETWVLSLGWEEPLEEEIIPTPVSLPGHGQRSLAGYRPGGCGRASHDSDYTATMRSVGSPPGGLVHRLGAAMLGNVQSALIPLPEIVPFSPSVGLMMGTQSREAEEHALSLGSRLGNCVKVKLLSHVRLFVTPWTVAYEAPPSVGFSTQEYWSGLPFPSPGDLPDPGIKPGLPHCMQMLYRLSYEGSPWELCEFSLFCSNHFPISVTRRYTIYKPAC